MEDEEQEKEEERGEEEENAGTRHEETPDTKADACVPSSSHARDRTRVRQKKKRQWLVNQENCLLSLTHTRYLPHVYG